METRGPVTAIYSGLRNGQNRGQVSWRLCLFFLITWQNLVLPDTTALYLSTYTPREDRKCNCIWHVSNCSNVDDQPAHTIYIPHPIHLWKTDTVCPTPLEYHGKLIDVKQKQLCETCHSFTACQWPICEQQAITAHLRESHIPFCTSYFFPLYLKRYSPASVLFACLTPQSPSPHTKDCITNANCVFLSFRCHKVQKRPKFWCPAMPSLCQPQELQREELCGYSSCSSNLH